MNQSNATEAVSPPSADLMPKILVCVDKSEEARAAWRFACTKAKRMQGRIVLLHVIPPANFQPLFAVADKLREENTKEADALLSTLSEETQQYIASAPDILLRQGNVGEEIINAVLADHQIHMIILGGSKESETHGKLVAWLAGQMNDKLLVPMMIIPANLTDQQIEQLT